MIASEKRVMDVLCQSINEFWTDCEGLNERLGQLYRNSGFFSKIDQNDQLRFLSALYTIVLKSDVRHVIQTGTHLGYSAMAVILAFQEKGIKGHIETIDPEPKSYGQEQFKFAVAQARKVVKSNQLDDYITFHKGYSVHPWDVDRMKMPDAPTHILNKLVAKKRCDLLIVDGDHTFNGTYWDLVFGAKTLRPDGPKLLFAHDYMSIKEVRMAIQTWRDENAERIDFRAYRKFNGYALMKMQ